MFDVGPFGEFASCYCAVREEGCIVRVLLDSVRWEELVWGYLKDCWVCDFGWDEGSGVVGVVGCDSLRLGEEIFSTDVVAGFVELVALCFEFLGHGLCVGEAWASSSLICSPMWGGPPYKVRSNRSGYYSSS